MNKLQIKFVKDAEQVIGKLSTWERGFILDLLDKLDLGLGETYTLTSPQNTKLNEINTKVVRLLSQKFTQTKKDAVVNKLRADFEEVTGRKPLPKSDMFEDDVADYDDDIPF